MSRYASTERKVGTAHLHGPRDHPSPLGARPGAAFRGNLPYGTRSARSYWLAPPEAHHSRQVGQRPSERCPRMESRCLRTRWARRCAPCGTQAHGCDIPRPSLDLRRPTLIASAQRGANLVGVRGGSDVAAPIIGCCRKVEGDHRDDEMPKATRGTPGREPCAVAPRALAASHRLFFVPLALPPPREASAPWPILRPSHSTPATMRAT